jgi:hypothetical protein
MPCIDQPHLESAGLQNLVDGNPMDARGFHRHTPHGTGREPVGEAQQIVREGRKRLHRRGVAFGRHGHEVFRRPTVDACDVRIQAVEHRG